MLSGAIWIPVKNEKLKMSSQLVIATQDHLVMQAVVGTRATQTTSGMLKVIVILTKGHVVKIMDKSDRALVQQFSFICCITALCLDGVLPCLKCCFNAFTIRNGQCSVAGSCSNCDNPTPIGSPTFYPPFVPSYLKSLFQDNNYDSTQ